MKTKTLIIIFASLLTIIIAQYFFFKYQNNILKNENLELIKEKKEAVKKIRDSAFSKINEITVTSKKRIDSIINIPPTIKWYPYEKPVFTNRSIDDALDVITRYNYNTKEAN